MTLTMADGPVAALPAGQDAYAGYVDASGIGVTFPGVVTRFPDARHLSISVHGNPAQVGDVEKGALKSWRGYPVGYTMVSNVMAQVAKDGRPEKLWTAHYDPAIGAHICGPHSCAYPGLTIAADGTQWRNGSYDESLLLDDFFDFGGSDMALTISADGCTIGGISPAGHVLVFSADPTKRYAARWQPNEGVSVSDVTAVVGPNYVVAP